MRYFSHLFALSAANRGELFFFTSFNGNGTLTKNELPDWGSNLSPIACPKLLIPLRHLSVLRYFFVNSKQIKKRWKIKAVIFFRKCSYFSGEFLQEMGWNGLDFFFCIQRNHGISYKNSQHFFDSTQRKKNRLEISSWNDKKSSKKGLKSLWPVLLAFFEYNGQSKNK